MLRPLAQTLNTLPHAPGVYLMRDVRAQVLYVGKAKNLRNRVRSYFRTHASLEPAKQLMVARVHDVETIVVRTEVEALLLESTLIKKHRPPYNIVLRDDKHFLYLAIDLADPFPTVAPVRRTGSRTTKYFGPYTSARSVYQTLELLKRLFGYRTCRVNQGRACFDYRLGRCLGFCIGAISKEEYRGVVQSILRFLSGHGEPVLAEVQKRMARAAAAEQYELAARYRDQARAIEHLLQRQDVILTDRRDADVVGIAREDDIAAIALLTVREGKLIRADHFLLEHTVDRTDAELLDSFLEQYVPRATDIPRRILVPVDLSPDPVLRQLTRAQIIRPHRGRGRRLLDLAHANAVDNLHRSFLTTARKQDQLQHALDELRVALRLERRPHRIEAYDMSNIQGTFAVGSMVVLEDGRARPAQYRRFRIQTVRGSDDPRMHAEVLRRRIEHLPGGKKTSWPRPDLILLDGGIPQLAAGRAVLRDAKIVIPIAALAKREEVLYLPGRSHPLRLARTSRALHILQRARDEAHRFAIGYYRTRHRAESVHSLLDAIVGLGPIRRRRLLAAFGSVTGIRAAPLPELTRIVGSGVARRLRQHLRLGATVPSHTNR